MSKCPVCKQNTGLLEPHVMLHCVCFNAYKGSPKDEITALRQRLEDITFIAIPGAIHMESALITRLGLTREQSSHVLTSFWLILNEHGRYVSKWQAAAKWLHEQGVRA